MIPPPDASRGMQALAGLVAREVDELLTLILGYTELALQDLDRPTALLDDLQVVRGSTERARLLTDGLHTLSRRRVVHPVRVDVGTWLAAEGPELARLAGSKVAVQTQTSAGAVVSIDPAQLELIITQLVRNAAAAYDDVGAVTVRVRRRTTDDGTGCVSISVRDRGRGMDAATLDRCAEPFFTTDRALEALGLGLAIAHLAALQAGGELRLSSRPGRGTTATLFLPALR